MKKLIFCTQEVNKSNIRRETRRGVEHIIITSFTLPPDIVMNGILYPHDVIKRDFKTFNRTPAPIEHPEIDGVFVLASDPEADFDFRIGAFNENAKIMEDGRLKLEKVINVKKALMSDKGKRLLDRIEEIETSSEARPIHTSIGALVKVDELDEPQTEFNGVKTNAEFSSIVTELIGDHDAFLLDSLGAATPSQGTGIGINSEHLKVEDYFLVNEDNNKQSEDLRINDKHDLSFDQITQLLYKALKDKLKDIDDIYPWIAAVYDDNFVYSLENTFYRASYEVDENGNVSVQDNKQEVVRNPDEFIDKISQSTKTTEDNAMKLREELIAFLTQSKIEVNSDISDNDLVVKYNEALIAASGNDTQIEVNKDLTDTVTDLTAQVGDLQTQLKANSDKNTSDQITVIKNCSKYSALPESALKLMANSDPKEFETMYNDSIPSVSIGSTYLANANTELNDDQFKVNVGDK